MEDLANALVRGIARAFGFFIINVLFEFCFYYLGWVIIKLVTLGHLPRGEHQNGWKSHSHEGTWVSAIGLLAFVIAGMLGCYLAGLL